MRPMDIIVSWVLEAWYSVVGAPGAVGYHGVRGAIRVCDLNGANQCRRTSRRFILELDRKYVAVQRSTPDHRGWASQML